MKEGKKDEIGEHEGWERKKGEKERKKGKTV